MLQKYLQLFERAFEKLDILLTVSTLTLCTCTTFYG